ncbi:MAG: aminoacyl-tRNA hydrolase [Bradymonadaceae bacterium]
MARYLIAGLGNPGRRYRETRHNVGFEVVDRLAERAGLRLSEEKFDAAFASGRVAGESAYLLEPQTMMNDSGQSVAPAARYFEIDLDRVVVVHDDVDLSVGRLAVKEGGSAGGHNGVESVARRLDDRGFVRVRVGVGRPQRGSVRDHVLSTFDASERRVVDEVVDAAAEAVEIVVAEGVAEAQNEYNGRDFS